MKYFLLSFVILISSFTFGNKSEVGRDYLIKKLERYRKTLPSKHPSKGAIILRLAHMLSLRAEHSISKKWSANCKTCFKEGVKDARYSLALYKQLERHMKANHFKLYVLSLFERAYLNRLIGDKERAISYLKKIISYKPQNELLVRAHFNLGEIYFKSYKYQPALNQFNFVLNKGDSKWAFQSAYRKIWSLYNLSRYKKSIQMLESFLASNLYKSQSLDSHDGLKNKIQNELVTFYSRAPLSQQSIDFLYQFKKSHPAQNTIKAKNKRLFDLGVALNRIGRVSQSNQIWKLYLTKEIIPLKRLEAYVYILDNHSFYGQFDFFKRAQTSLQETFNLIVRIRPCYKGICKVVKGRMRQYLLKNQDVKNKSLRKGFFAKYNSIYKKEFNMIFYEARLAKDLKQYKQAQDLFQKSVLSFKIDSNLSRKDKDNLERDKEKAGILQMEMAEFSKDTIRQNNAYDFYLRYGTNIDLLFQAKYQKSYLTYKNKDYVKSARLFKELALDKKVYAQKSESLKIKAAHLALTSLSFIGNDKLMMKWSYVFSQSFSKNKGEFLKMRNTAIFNIVKNLVSNKTLSNYPIARSSNRGVIKAWDTLLKVNFKRLTQKEKVNFYVNKLLLAKELFNLKEVKGTINKLSSLKLGKSDRRLVLESQLWLAETEFDFKKMLKFIKRLNPKDRSKEHLIYLGHLAELAGGNYAPIYAKFIKKYPDSEEAFSLAVRMVNLASSRKQKISLLKKYQNQFVKKPEVFSYFILKVDSGKLNRKFIGSFLNKKSMQSSNLAQFMRRRQFIHSFKKQNVALEKFSIPSKISQRGLTRSLKKYKTLLQDLESRANQAITLQDWTSQIVAFSVVKRELNRFYNSILNLPVSKNLTAEEIAKYTELLKNQIAPYKLRANTLDKKLTELWRHDYTKAYSEVYTRDPVFQKPIRWEIKQLQEFTPERKKRALRAIVSQKSVKSSAPHVPKDSINYAFSKVKLNPFNRSAIKKLLKLESNRKNEAMIFYLETRLKKINAIATERRVL